MLDFSPIIQNETEATFTKLLSKKDAYLDLNSLDSNYVFNHFRAYKIFPTTIAVEIELFGVNIRLIDISLPETGLLEKITLNQLETVFKSESWIVLKLEKKQICLYNCRTGLIQINKIMNQNGKIIDLSGFQF